MSFDNSRMSLEEIEQLEHFYLMKYWYFLKFVEDDIVKGLSSKDDIRKDWEGLYGGEGGISQFDVGCERIIYALLNGKIAGQPNSSPVSSDLFFEVDDAFIHIDLKSVTTSEVRGKNDNIGDYNNSIFVGENQNSYTTKIVKYAGKKNEYFEDYNPNLPVFYTKKNGDKKITLTYLVCLLNSSLTQKCEMVSIMCVPNGRLEKHYGNRPLCAGKNHGEARFKFTEVSKFELLSGNKKRARVVYVNPDMSEYVRRNLKFYFDNFIPQIEE